MELGQRSFRAAFMAAVLAGGLAVSGCNENVEVLRDPSIRVAKGMTWAWRPQGQPPSANTRRSPDGRPVVSRDVIGAEPAHLESSRDWNTEANRAQLQQAIERSLKGKGLVQVNDPAAADFLVDYHVAVKTQNAVTQSVYPGGYPGVACGPYGCWSGWGWGPPEVEYRTVRYHEGTFVFDMALRSPKKLAYRAIGQKELNNKTTISQYQAEEAVGHLLKGLKVQ
ncbi:MAG TPA: DUF4136 domain-containing protein [Dongiaceae bacterium]|nr:DUF4136 domain-containing protein [Dongiaceae bacterium]